MKNNPVSKLFSICIEDEIANEVVIRDGFTVKLSDGTYRVVVKEIVDLDDDCDVERITAVHNSYVTKHNYGAIGRGKANKLLLKNFEDLQDYLRNVILTNLIDAELWENNLVSIGEFVAQIVIEKI